MAFSHSRDMSSFVQDMIANPSNLIVWLQEIGLLASSRICSKCNKHMTLIYRSQKADGFVWYCGNCHTETCVRKGSIFAETPRASIVNVFRFIWHFSLNLKSSTLQGFVSKKTCRHLANVLEHVCISALHRNFPTFPQGTFAIDESAFMKRKYNRGRHVKTRWVFGMVNLDHPTKPMFFYVPKRDTCTLLPIISKNIPQGSTIVSDQWRAYSILSQQAQYLHLTVNHSQTFVDPNTGAHTNNIEVVWKHAKEFLKGRQCRQPERLQWYLYLYMWFQWFGRDFPGGSFVRLLNDIAAEYPLD